MYFIFFVKRHSFYLKTIFIVASDFNLDKVLDVSKYWKSRGPGYYAELQNQPRHLEAILKEQEKNVIKILKNCKFESILEVGCGSGRFTKILNDFFKPKRYVATDLSKEQLENAKKYVKNNKIDFICIEGKKLDFPEQFDLVFASEVLMHIKVEEIEEIIRNMVNLSNRKIITIDWFDENKIGEELGGYCFVHDYPKLFKNYKVSNMKIHKLSIPISSRLIGAYAKLRGRHGIESQAIFEIDV